MNNRDQRDLQLWLDGLLSEEERSAFESKLASDPDLREERSMHESLAGSLQRSFVPKSVDLPSPKDVPPAATPAPRWPWFFLGASAAAIAIFCLPQFGQPEPEPELPPKEVAELASARCIVGRSWTALYAEVAAVCGQVVVPPSMGCDVVTSLPQFVKPLAPELGGPFSWQAQPSVRFRRGLDASQSQDQLRILEFVAVPETSILVFVLRKSEDPQAILPASGSRRLYLFRAVRGPLVLYELSPFPQRRVLPGLAMNVGERRGR